MKNLSHLIVYLLIMALMSCQSKKSSSETMKQSDENMIAEGFKKATVIYSITHGDCEYTLAIDGQTGLLDPINLENTFQKSQTKIWVKYNPLRMPNRCEKASPIEITDINLRK